MAVQYMTELLTLTEELKQDHESEPEGGPGKDAAADELATLQKQYTDLQLNFQSSAQALTPECTSRKK